MTEQTEFRKVPTIDDETMNKWQLVFFGEEVGKLTEFVHGPPESPGEYEFERERDGARAVMVDMKDAPQKLFTEKEHGSKVLEIAMAYANNEAVRRHFPTPSGPE